MRSRPRFRGQGQFCVLLSFLVLCGAPGFSVALVKLDQRISYRSRGESKRFTPRAQGAPHGRTTWEDTDNQERELEWGDRSRIRPSGEHWEGSRPGGARVAPTRFTSWSAPKRQAATSAPTLWPGGPCSPARTCKTPSSPTPTPCILHGPSPHPLSLCTLLLPAWQPRLRPFFGGPRREVP